MGGILPTGFSGAGPGFRAVFFAAGLGAAHGFTGFGAGTAGLREAGSDAGFFTAVFTAAVFFETEAAGVLAAFPERADFWVFFSITLSPWFIRK
jgi:hypothetical protein